MNLTTLAQTRAECAARLEAVSQLTPAGDREEQAAHQQARARARAAYREAEDNFARAICTMTATELADVGL